MAIFQAKDDDGLTQQRAMVMREAVRVGYTMKAKPMDFSKHWM